MKRLVALSVCVLVVGAASVPAHAAKQRDRVRPKVSYVTEDGAVLASGPAGEASDQVPAHVIGRASDDRAIRTVRAVWVPCTTSDQNSCSFVGSDTTFHDAGPVSVTCHHRARRCDWRAPTPTAPGTYWFAATATDRAGNSSRGSGILRITVV